MKNRFSVNESEKSRIRGLHNINEDAGMDTPGGNPEYFYGDGSLDKLRNMDQVEVTELSTEEIIKNLWQIQGLLMDNSPEMAMERITLLLGELGAEENPSQQTPLV
jgi:hypothetical protein